MISKDHRWTDRVAENVSDSGVPVLCVRTIGSHPVWGLGTLLASLGLITQSQWGYLRSFALGVGLLGCPTLLPPLGYVVLGDLAVSLAAPRGFIANRNCGLQ